jgi:hypothetical protein
VSTCGRQGLSKSYIEFNENFEQISGCHILMNDLLIRIFSFKAADIIAQLTDFVWGV